MITIFNLPPVIFALVVGALAICCILIGYNVCKMIVYDEVEMDISDLEDERDFYKRKYNQLKKEVAYERTKGLHEGNK